MSLLVTGHDIFDTIVKIPYSSSILIVDENFSESKQLLTALLSSKDNNIRFAEISAKKNSVKDAETMILAESTNINSTNASVSNFRQSHRRWVIIHAYLPDLLVRFPNENVLRMIDSWRSKINEAETAEIFILPKDTFNDVEKRLRSISDGVIELSSSNHADNNKRFFTPIRCTTAEYDVRRFEYLIHKSRLKIRWGQDFIESFPHSYQSEHIQKMKLIESQKTHLNVVKGAKEVIEDLSLKDKLLLSQILNKDVEQILTLFHDKKQSVLETIVKWNINGIIDLKPIQGKNSIMLKRKLNLATKLMLLLPTGFASMLLKREVKHRQICHHKLIC